MLMRRLQRRVLVIKAATLVALSCGTPGLRAGQENSTTDVVSSMKCQVRKDNQRTFFLMSPQSVQKVPEKGYGLVLILPGGDGSADFQPFLKRVYAQSVPRGFLAAQLVAVKWSAGQQITWPTRTNKVAGQKFATEDFVESVIEEIGTKYPLDRRRILTLSWSSGGPAAYAVSWSENSSVTGSFVAMSIFRPDSRALKRAEGHAYFIYHSPTDKVCRFSMARQAATTLEKQGAETKLVEYLGGHGWHGNVFEDIRSGLAWLVERTDKAAYPATQVSTRPVTANTKTAVEPQ